MIKHREWINQFLFNRPTNWPVAVKKNPRLISLTSAWRSTECSQVRGQIPPSPVQSAVNNISRSWQRWSSFPKHKTFDLTSNRGTLTSHADHKLCFLKEFNQIILNHSEWGRQKSQFNNPDLIVFPRQSYSKIYT